MLENLKTLSSQESITMTKLEKVLGDFSEKYSAKWLIKSIDKAERNAEKKYPESIERHKIEKIPTIEGKLKYAKEKNLEDRPDILGSIESARASRTPMNDKELRSRAAKYGAITKASNYQSGKTDKK